MLMMGPSYLRLWVVVVLMHLCGIQAGAMEPRSMRSSAQQGALKKLSGLSGVAAFLLTTYAPEAGATVERSASTIAVPTIPARASQTSMTIATAKTAAEQEMKNEPSFVSSLASGAASRASKEVILHPVDTVRARLQTQGEGTNSNSSWLYSDLYNGVVPALVSGVPAGAVFFAVKDSSKKYLRKQQGMDKRAATILSVAAANIPYWLIRNPSEVLKTRQQIDDSVEQQNVSLFSFLQGGGREELYRGYLPNIGYAYPADVIKFLVYETLVDEMFGGRKLLGAEAALAGACAGLTAQVLTTPLDVVRTNVMANTTTTTVNDMYAQGGAQALFRGVKPRAVRAVGSGAIQFASYELTQNLF